MTHKIPSVSFILPPSDCYHHHAWVLPEYTAEDNTGAVLGHRVTLVASLLKNLGEAFLFVYLQNKGMKCVVVKHSLKNIYILKKNIRAYLSWLVRIYSPHHYQQ